VQAELVRQRVQHLRAVQTVEIQYSEQLHLLAAAAADQTMRQMDLRQETVVRVVVMQVVISQVTRRPVFRAKVTMVTIAVAIIHAVVVVQVVPVPFILAMVDLECSIRF
jgi:hypothetical protein